jgi:hypothetical protein
VERVWRELAPEGGVTTAAGAHAEIDPAANPQVRVVRRLWG